MITHSPEHHRHSDDEFDVFAAAVSARFDLAIETHGPQLFKVDAGNLYATYLNNLPLPQIQGHTCRCCQRFIEQYGDLAVIDDDGQLRSPLWAWEDVPSMYSQSVLAMQKSVARGKITSVFVSKEKSWGINKTGDWTHFAVTPLPNMLHKSIAVEPHQAAAAKLQDFGTLNRALAEFSRDQVAQVVNMLEAEALYRSEKVIGPARWLLTLQDARANAKNKQTRDNITWLAVASAPAGFCTPRSSMIGTLLEDIAAGMDFATVKRRFNAKMDPQNYLRPQAAATAGNIAQAEKLVQQMGVAKSLERRYARLDEIQTIWKPTTEQPQAQKGGVFGHLQPKGQSVQAGVVVPPQAITFEKFRRTVLPSAKKIEFKMNSFRMGFCAMTTAVHSDAPPILQWDSEEVRNPVSSYVYQNGSSPRNWGLLEGHFVPVTALSLRPNLWADEDKFGHQGKGVVFVLEGAKDSSADSCGLALFPEALKSELHQIRSVIESHSRYGKLQGTEEASANGILISAGNSGMDNVVRVTSDVGVVQYKIDRWD